MENYYDSLYYRQTLTPEDEMLHDKGKYGEYLVTCCSGELGKANGVPVYVYNNILLPLPNGSCTEMDIIFLSRMGIHVIEVKNWGGSLKISFEHDDWRQSMGYDDNTHYSPLSQNNFHINMLVNYLKEKAAEAGRNYTLEELYKKLVNVVVFPSAEEWDLMGDPVPLTTPYYIGSLDSYKDTVFSQLLTEDEVEFFRPLLIPIATLSSTESQALIMAAKEKHIRQNQKYFYAEEGSCKYPGMLCMEDSNGYTYFYDPIDYKFKCNYDYALPEGVRKNYRYDKFDKARYSNEWRNNYYPDGIIEKSVRNRATEIANS